MNEEIKNLLPKKPGFSMGPMSKAINTAGGYVNVYEQWISKDEFDTWYIREIVPTLENSIEVVSVIGDTINSAEWCRAEQLTKEEMSLVKYKARLIGIKTIDPIEQSVTKEELSCLLEEVDGQLFSREGRSLIKILKRVVDYGIKP